MKRRPVPGSNPSPVGSLLYDFTEPVSVLTPLRLSSQILTPAQMDISSTSESLTSSRSRAGRYTIPEESGTGGTSWYRLLVRTSVAVTEGAAEFAGVGNPTTKAAVRDTIPTNPDNSRRINPSRARTRRSPSLPKAMASKTSLSDDRVRLVDRASVE